MSVGVLPGAAEKCQVVSLLQLVTRPGASAHGQL